MEKFLCIVSIVACVTTPAFATNRFYGNLKALSPNGRYEAEATSPANRKGNYETPFQKGFTIVFRDTKTGKIIWTWRQGQDDASPAEMIPTDSGHLIMRDGCDTYHIFDANGGKTEVANVFRLLTKEEEKFTTLTSAGVFWSQYSQQGFLDDRGHQYFYIRLYWGRTFIFDVNGAKLDAAADLAQRIEDHVVHRTRQTIRGFDGEYLAPCPHGCKHLRDELTEAVFVIRKYDMPEGRALAEAVVKRSDDGRNRDLPDYLKRVEVVPEKPQLGERRGTA